MSCTETSDGNNCPNQVHRMNEAVDLSIFLSMAYKTSLSSICSLLLSGTILSPISLMTLHPLHLHPLHHHHHHLISRSIHPPSTTTSKPEPYRRKTDVCSETFSSIRHGPQSKGSNVDLARHALFWRELFTQRAGRRTPLETISADGQVFLFFCMSLSMPSREAGVDRCNKRRRRKRFR